MSNPEKPVSSDATKSDIVQTKESSGIPEDGPITDYLGPIIPPKWFWGVAVVALLWNLAGFSMFIVEATMSEEALSKLPQAQQELRENSPAWVQIAFAIATTCGVLGCVGLLMRKNWAIPVFAISMIAVLAQMSYVFFMSNTIEVMGSTPAIMSGAVVAISISLFLFSLFSADRGWLR